MLHAAFQRIGEEIEPPPSQKLWAKLQQLPEFAPLQETEEKFAGIPDARELRGKKHTGPRTEYRYIAGLVAACLVLIAVFVNFNPSSRKGGNLVSKLLSLAPGTKDQMEISIQDSEDKDKTSPVLESEEMTILKTYSLGTNDTGAGVAPAPRISSLEDPTEPKTESGATAPPGSGESAGLHQEQESLHCSELQANLIEPEQKETQELAFTEGAAFSHALTELKNLAPEGIWHIKYTSEELIFLEGAIIKTEKTLFSVQQAYKTSEGNEFSLSQQFLPENNALERAIVTADRTNSLDQPIQVGPYNGYLRRLQSGFHILTWLQEHSIVTLTGELKEEQLYEILALMDNYGS